MWESFLTGVGRKVRDGHTTRFWVDMWLPLEHPLRYYVVDTTGLELEAKVCEFTLPSGGWDYSKWDYLLPSNLTAIISKVTPPQSVGRDFFTWRPDKDGAFSVQSAYNFLSHGGDATTQPFWERMWQWNIPEKLKFFLWHVSHGRLSTNAARATWAGNSEDA